MDKPLLHYLPYFTRELNGLQQTFCGVYVDPKYHSAEPTCEYCKAELERDTKDFDSMLQWSIEQDAIKAGRS